MIWLFAALAVFSVGVAYADDLEMTMHFSATGHTEAEAVDRLRELASEAGYGVGEASTVRDGGVWEASGNITLVGSPAELLAVEEKHAGLYSGLTVVGEGRFGEVMGGSVSDLGGQAEALLGLGILCLVVGAFVAAACVWFRMWLIGLVFGAVFGGMGVFMVVEHLNYAQYALP